MNQTLTGFVTSLALCAIFFPEGKCTTLQSGFSFYRESKVEALPESVQTEGDYTPVFSVANLLSGVYILKMTVDGSPFIQQIVVQR